MGAGFFKASYFHDLRLVDFTAEQEVEIRNEIAVASNDCSVLVYSKAYCPYCTKTKQLLKRLDVETKVVEINQRRDGLQVQAILYKITGRQTVPNTFIGGKPIGGNQELQTIYQSGELKKVLDEAGIKHNIS
jgi:glutaredoxin 3